MAQNPFLHALGSPFRLFKAICFWVGFSVIVALTATFAAIFMFLHALPEVENLHFSDLQTKAQSVIQQHYTQEKKHTWVKIDHINRDLLYAIVMAEDSDFFTHKGIDHDAIIDALFENVKSDTIKYGASTISQQVSKNLFLGNEKNIVRKIKEYFITRDIEKKFSKNDILEIYLNMAEFGPNIYGVEEASRHYFGKKPADIHAAEAAFMALMLPSPRKYHYTLFQNHNFTKSLKRKYQRIIKDMRFKGYISAKQYSDYRDYEFFQQGR